MSNVAEKDFFTPPDVRVWLHIGPTRPGAAYQYLGNGETLATEVKLGERAVIRVQSRRQRGKWDVVGSKFTPPDLHSTGLHMMMPRATASFVEEQAATGCLMNVQVVVGKCNSPDEFRTGWESKLLYEGLSLNNLKISEMASVEGDKIDPVYIDSDAMFEFYARITAIRFGEKAGTEILAEAVSGTFAGPPSCGDCGPYSDGNDHLYVVTKANPGSPGLSGQLVYTNDLGTFNIVDIPTLGGLSPNEIAEVGDYLLVVSEDKRNLQYVRRDPIITADDWVAVSSGFVAGKGPRAIYVKHPGSVFFAGAGGYLYEAENYQESVTAIETGSLTAGNYNDVHGDGDETVVAVGDNNVVVVSTNSGLTFTLLTGPAVGQDLQAVFVLDANTWIVGGDGGAFYRTLDQGVTWTAIPFADQGSGAIIHDIQFCEQTKTVGYMCVEVGGRGLVYRTTDGGTFWSKDAPHVRGMTANARLDFVAPSPNSVNVVATGGLAAVGTDGYLAVGA